MGWYETHIWSNFDEVDKQTRWLQYFCSELELVQWLMGVHITFFQSSQ